MGFPGKKTKLQASFFEPNGGPFRVVVSWLEKKGLVLLGFRSFLIFRALWIWCLEVSGVWGFRGFEVSGVWCFRALRSLGV